MRSINVGVAARRATSQLQRHGDRRRIEVGGLQSRSVAIAAAAVTAVAVLGACSSPPSALGAPTAKISINGHPVGTTQQVSCRQVGNAWTITTLKNTPGFTASLDTGGKVVPTSVEIRGLDGFTGSYWQGTVGNADGTFSGNKFTITGTAVGFTADKPNQRAEGDFKIETGC